MAILSREDFMLKLQHMAGDDISDDTLTAISDMTETFDSLVNGDGVDWKQRYEENDANWRKKYRDRFFNTPADDDPPPQDTHKPLLFDDLFKKGD